MIGPLAVLAFTAELVALVALGLWGQQAGGWPLAVLAPLAFAVVWGFFLAPRATLPLPQNAQITLKLILFSLAGLAAYRTWGVWPASVFFLTAVTTSFL